MLKYLTRAGKLSGRYLALAMVTATLVACGGSSGDSTGDRDGDGLPDSEDTDADGDGIEDSIDTFVDLDGDGFDDIIGDQDFDNDGLLNKNDPDADGDGIDDGSDSFVDLDGDGFDDFTGEPDGLVFRPVTASEPCGNEPGTDNDSSNADWGDNCWVRRAEKGTGGNDDQGQWATSLFTVGIQRVVYCAPGSEAAGSSYTAFVDGIFGPNTEAAVRSFQAQTPGLGADGEVGSATWGALQDALSVIGRVDVNEIGIIRDIYGIEYADGVTPRPCEAIPLFYQDLTVDPETAQLVQGGWSLAPNNATLGGAIEPIPFSISPDVNAVD